MIDKGKDKPRYWSPKNKCKAYVYVVEVGFDNLYKIGWAKDVDRRVKELSAANPRARKVLAVKVGHAKRVEYELHWLYQDQHRERELFWLDGGDLADIQRYLEANRLDKRKKEKKRICAACGSVFFTNKNHFLCPECAHKAFDEHVCPFCGIPIVGERRGKPSCRNCANLWGATVKGESRRCAHVNRDGKQCQRWAMHGSYYCKDHQKAL